MSAGKDFISLLFILTITKTSLLTRTTSLWLIKIPKLNILSSIFFSLISKFSLVISNIEPSYIYVPLSFEIIYVFLLTCKIKYIFISAITLGLLEPFDSLYSLSFWLKII